MPENSEKYSYHHPRTEVRQAGKKGVAVFTTGPISKGEVVIVTGGRILPFDSMPSYPLPYHPFQVEKDQVIAPFDVKNLDGIFVVNHSCSPNTGLRGQCSLVALRNIEAKEEICFDYCMTDSDPAGQEYFSMDCLCEAPNCRKRITDLDWRRPELQKKYAGYFSAYIQNRIAPNRIAEF